MIDPPMFKGDKTIEDLFEGKVLILRYLQRLECRMVQLENLYNKEIRDGKPKYNFGKILEDERLRIE